MKKDYFFNEEGLKKFPSLPDASSSKLGKDLSRITFGTEIKERFHACPYRTVRSGGD
jgi:hypothetical protein